MEVGNSPSIRLCGISSIVLTVLSLFLFSSCGKKNEVGRAVPLGSLTGAQFQPYDESRSIIDSIATDLNGDGVKEIILTSRDSGYPVNPILPKVFDRFEAFALDTASGLYASLFIDPVESGSQIQIRDVTLNGKKEVLIQTDLGGNDAITSQGLNIYGYRPDGRFTTLFFSQEGSPELRDLNGDGIPEILLSDEYRGLMSHAEGIGFIREVHAYDGDLFTPANSFFKKYFDAEIQQRRAEYLRSKNARVRDEEEHNLNLFRAFVAWLLWMNAKGDKVGVAKIWNAERPSLSNRFTAEVIDEIEDLVQDLLTQPESLSQGRELQQL